MAVVTVSIDVESDDAPMQKIHMEFYYDDEDVAVAAAQSILAGMVDRDEISLEQIYDSLGGDYEAD